MSLALLKKLLPALADNVCNFPFSIPNSFFTLITVPAYSSFLLIFFFFLQCIEQF